MPRSRIALVTALLSVSLSLGSLCALGTELFRTDTANFGTDLWQTELLPSAQQVPTITAEASPSTVIAPPAISFGGWLHDTAYDTVDLTAVDEACEECPRRTLIALVGYDTWRGVSDGTWQNNGIHSGLNFGTRLGRISDLTGIGFQMGATAGAYNWSGTDYRLRNNDQAQPQGFVTGGFFRRATESCPWSGAIVQDWMINANYGVFAQNPTMGQWRGMLGYVVNPANEFGVWGAWRARGDTRDVGPPFGQVIWRPVNQLNGFWHYKWGPGQSDTWIWIGKPENTRLAGGGSLGDWIVGLLANVPLSDRVGLYALVTYMHQSSAPGISGAADDAWNFTTGLAFYPARNSRSYSVAGQRWMPLMPMANNGYFLVDTNKNF